MLYKRTGLDWCVRAHVRSGGLICDEYNASQDTSNTLCCYVAVEPGRKIEVSCDFSGTTKHLHYDLIIDGVLRNTKVHHASKEKRFNKYELFQHAYYRVSKALRKADIQIENISDPPPTFSDGGTFDVGCVEVRVYIQQINSNVSHLPSTKRFDEISTWRSMVGLPRLTQLPPTLEAGMLSSASEPDLLPRHKWRVTQPAKAPRPGHQPWAIFKFYYREKDAISAAGLVKSNGTSYTLAPLQAEHKALPSTALGGSTPSTVESQLPEAPSEGSDTDDPDVNDFSNEDPEAEEGSKIAELAPYLMQAPHVETATETGSIILVTPLVPYRSFTPLFEPGSRPSPWIERADPQTADKGDARATCEITTVPSDLHDHPASVIVKTEDDVGINNPQESGLMADTPVISVPATSEGNAAKREISADRAADAKRTKIDLTEEEDLVEQRLKVLNERRRMRVEAESRAEQAKVKRKDMLRKRLEEIEHEIEDENRRFEEAERECRRSEEALRSYEP